MFDAVFEFILNTDNRIIIGGIFGGIVVIIRGLWEVYKFFRPPNVKNDVPDEISKKLTVQIRESTADIKENFKEATAEINETLKEIAHKIARDKGVPVEPLLAVLKKLGQDHVPVSQIPDRLHCAADELLILRKIFATSGPNSAERPVLREYALSLIERGKLSSRGLFGGRISDEHWIPLGDLMTGLMMIFMLISLCFLIEFGDKWKKLDCRAEQARQAATSYYNTRYDIYVELKNVFSAEFNTWGAVLDEDLTVKFSDLNILFESQRSELKIDFEKILRSFFPRYMDILYKKTYRDFIEEIRIEGHTSSNWESSTTQDDAYLKNMELSQARTRAVLQFVLALFRNNDMQKWLIGHLTANGLSSSKLIFLCLLRPWSSSLPIPKHLSRLYPRCAMPFRYAHTVSGKRKEKLGTVLGFPARAGN